MTAYENVGKLFFFHHVRTPMSFTEGAELQFKTGDVVSKITDKYGSFIVFIWPEAAGGTTSAWSVSKNNQHTNVRRLSCCYGADEEHIVPTVEADGIHWNLNNGATGVVFNMKILG